MIYFTGDTHGGHDMGKLSNRTLKVQGKVLTKDDYLIILGDFGFPFLDEEIDETNGEYTYWINWLASKPYTVLWVDGNHDNHPFWNNQPITEWNGGRVHIHPRASNVIHLMRGEIYTIDGKKFFAFGGAASHDKEYRTPNFDWWEDEEASIDDIENAETNLSKHCHDVDYIIAHTPPAGLLEGFYGVPVECKTAKYLDTVVKSTVYKAYLCGHIHRTTYMTNNRFMSIYNDVVSEQEVIEYLTGGI